MRCHESSKTTVITVRILRSQAQALKVLQQNENLSSLARKLFSLYLDGKIPEAQPLQRKLKLSLSASPFPEENVA